MAITTAALIDDSIKTAFEVQAMITAGQNNIMEPFLARRIEIGAAKIELPRYSRLSPATTPLTDGQDVTPTSLADTKVVFTPVEYGQVVTVTQLASLQSGGTVDLAAAEVVGLSMGNTLDTLAIAALEASTNVLTPSGAAVGSLTVNNDKITKTFLNKLRNKLQRNFVPTFDNGLYAIVLHPDVIADLRDDASAGSWVDIVKSSMPGMALAQDVAVYQGFLIVADANAVVSAATVKGYSCYAFGKNALGRATSLPEQIVIAPPTDYLQRLASIGWKTTTAYGILDASSVIKGVVASAFAA